MNKAYKSKRKPKLEADKIRNSPNQEKRTDQAPKIKKDDLQQLNPNSVSHSSSVYLHNQNRDGSQSIISSTLHCSIKDLSLVSTLDGSVFWE